MTLSYTNVKRHSHDSFAVLKFKETYQVPEFCVYIFELLEVLLIWAIGSQLYIVVSNIFNEYLGSIINHTPKKNLGYFNSFASSFSENVNLNEQYTSDKMVKVVAPVPIRTDNTRFPHLRLNPSKKSKLTLSYNQNNSTLTITNSQEIAIISLNKLSLVGINNRIARSLPLLKSYPINLSFSTLSPRLLITFPPSSKKSSTNLKNTVDQKNKSESETSKAIADSIKKSLNIDLLHSLGAPRSLNYHHIAPLKLKLASQYARLHSNINSTKQITL